MKEQAWCQKKELRKTNKGMDQEKATIILVFRYDFIVELLVLASLFSKHERAEINLFHLKL